MKGFSKTSHQKVHPKFAKNFGRQILVWSQHKLSVEPKVQLQGYGYSLFCSHCSCCLEALIWQCFEEAFCAPKVRLKWYGFKGFPLIAHKLFWRLSSTVLRGTRKLCDFFAPHRLQNFYDFFCGFLWYSDDFCSKTWDFALCDLKTLRCSEKVFVSQERVSGFPEKGADLRGGLENSRGAPGNSGKHLGNWGSRWGTSREGNFRWSLGLGSCGPGKLPEKWKFPKVVRRGCKRSFGPREQEASCTVAKWGCTGAKEGLGGAKDSWETFAPWAQKSQNLLHPPLNTFGDFLFWAIFHAQHDWKTGAPDNGNEWRKFRAVPRLHPLRSLVLYIV